MGESPIYLRSLDYRLREHYLKTFNGFKVLNRPKDDE